VQRDADCRTDIRGKVKLYKEAGCSEALTLFLQIMRRRENTLSRGSSVSIVIVHVLEGKGFFPATSSRM